MNATRASSRKLFAEEGRRNSNGSPEPTRAAATAESAIRKTAVARMCPAEDFRSDIFLVCSTKRIVRQTITRRMKVLSANAATAFTTDPPSKRVELNM